MIQTLSKRANQFIMKTDTKETEGEMEKPIEPEINLTKILVRVAFEEGQVIFVAEPEERARHTEKLEEVEVTVL